MRFITASVNQLDKGFILTAERYESRHTGSPVAGVPLSEVALLSRVTTSAATAPPSGRHLVLDTGDASEGILALRRAPIPGSALGSTKKIVQAGDVLVSRLRPYLRQVALVDDDLVADAGTTLACSTEFFVLRPSDDSSLAFLVPWLLNDGVQSVLASAVEGGHHPRFNAMTLMSLVVPTSVMSRRDASSRAVEGAVRDYRAAMKTIAQEVSLSQGPSNA